jgi:hypothetical protein
MRNATALRGLGPVMIDVWVRRAMASSSAGGWRRLRRWQAKFSACA